MKGPCFSGTDPYRTGDMISDLRDLFFGHLHETNHLLGSLPEHLAFFGEGDLPVAAYEERCAKLILQFLHLA